MPSAKGSPVLSSRIIVALLGFSLCCYGADRPFFIEAEDFDFDSGQHRPAADIMPYLGGAYSGLSATAEVDYHDPGANEYAQYRPPSQGVATIGTADLYRDSFELTTNFKIGYLEPGDWMNYTRVFPEPGRDYNIFARLSSGAGPNGIQLDEVVSGRGTTNQTLSFVGRAAGPASGGWDYFLYVPVIDSDGRLARFNGNGLKTLRVTMLNGSNQDFNYLQFVPIDSSVAGACVSALPGLVAWWPGDGNPLDYASTNHGKLQNGAVYASGKSAQAFSFDGVNDFVLTSVDAQPTAMPSTTWECWVFPTAVNGARSQILSTDDGGYDRSLLIEGGKFGIFTGGGVWYPVGSTPNQWQHVVVAFTAQNIEFYKNGERFSLGSAPAGQGTGNYLNIGRNPGFGEYFTGRIDEIGIYNRALSETEVQGIFAAGAGGRCKTASPCPILVFAPTTLPDAIVGTPYSYLISVTGGSEDYTFAAGPGNFPAGLNLSTNGLLSGTIFATGTYRFEVSATASNGCSQVQFISLATMRPTPPCNNLPSGLLSWWRAEGSALDTVGPNNGGELNGTTFAPGQVGQAFKLNGTTNFIQMPAQDLTVGEGDFTLEGWIQTTGTKGYNAIASFDSYSPGLYIRGNGVLQLYPHGASSDAADAKFNDGKFHHFAVVRTNGVVSYFRDGVSVGSVLGTISLKPAKFYIGTSTYAGENFEGLIDELCFYNRGLRPDEVKNIFALGSAGKCGNTAPVKSPDIALSATALNFGTNSLGSSRELSLSLTNVGTGDLRIQSIRVDNAAFQLLSAVTPTDIAAGATVLLTVRFSPTSAGPQNGVLAITSNDPDEPSVSVALAGTGTTNAPPGEINAPVITNINPATPAPGTLVTVAGANFGANPNDLLVRFGNHLGIVQSASGNQVVVQVPLAASGPTAVTVTMGGQRSDPFTVLVASSDSTMLQITGVALRQTDNKLHIATTFSDPNSLVLESADSAIGPWLRTSDFQIAGQSGVFEFIVPLSTQSRARFFRLARFAPTGPMIRFISPKTNVRPGLPVTLLGSGFSQRASENVVRFDLPTRSWTASVLEAGTNYVVVSVPVGLLTLPGTNLTYRVTVTTARGTSNGVGCGIFNDTFNTFALRPDESFIVQNPGTGVETLAVGGGIPPYRLVPLTATDQTKVTAELNGPVLTVRAVPGVTFGSALISVEDSSFPPQKASSTVIARKFDFDPPLTTVFHTLLAGTSPGVTITARQQSLQPEQMEVRFHNAGISLANLAPGSILGLVRFYYSGSLYGLQQIEITDIGAGQAQFDVVSLDQSLLKIADGELTADPPSLRIRALGQTAASIMPTTVDQEIILSDEVIVLPNAGGEKFSVETIFTSVSAREDRYVPLTKTIVQEFVTTNLPPTAPRIERLLPVHGEIFHLVTLNGSGFSTDPLKNEVTFASYGAERISGSVISGTANELVVAVPRDAVAGPVRVTVAGQTSNDSLFFARFHPSAALFFDRFESNTPVAPRLVHQQPVDDGDTLDEVPLDHVTYQLDQGRLEVVGLAKDQQVGLSITKNFYTSRSFTNVLVYAGREANGLQRHIFETRTSVSSSFAISRLYVLEESGGGVKFESTGGFVPLNPGGMIDYQFSNPIYRPPSPAGTPVKLRVEMVSQRWISPPGTEMKVIEHSEWRVK